MNSAVTAQPTSGPTLWARYGVIVVAWLFGGGAVVQVFLAGRSLFESASYWQDHADFGRMIGVLAYLLPIVALIGRAGKPVVGHAFVVTVLYLVQMLLPDVDAGWIAALHPVNAFLLIGASFSLGARTRELVRSSGAVTPPAGAGGAS